MKHISHKTLKGVGLLLLSAFLFSLMPVMIRILGGGGIPPISQVFLRYVVACMAACIYFFFVKRSSFAVQRKYIGVLLIATVFGYALTNVFFTYGILLTQVSNALFLFYSYAVITPILGYVFLKEKTNTSNIIALLISIIGLVLLYQPNSFVTWRIGGLFALLSALGQSAYIIARKKLPEYSAGFMLLANTFVGVVVVGIMSLVFENQFYFQNQLSQISLHTWTVTMLFGIDNFFAWLAMTKGFEYFQATMGSLILLTEIMFGMIFALILFAEIPTILTLMGGVLILTASTLVIVKST